ncbi:MAG: nucleotidyltransferase domain-containing protein [Oscillospiraceae bacterium]|nr:nucleotidyltransferase domain-containing protein [Oscillospiraceae bacterium]
MNTKMDNDLKIIKESVLQAVSAEAIYLFGSYAYGTPRDDSDIDIYVVVPDGTTELGELYADIIGLVRKNKGRLDLDLLMGCSSVFNRRKNGPTLERVIAQRGAVLYGA